MKEKEILIKGALLHDIGKVCYRAMNKRINHSKLGGDFLEQYLKSNEETERLLNCVRYHHKDYLQKAKLDKNDLAYIVYEADNIASGMDRRENEGEEKGFDPKLNLDSIFSVFYSDKEIQVANKYPLIYKDINKSFNYPRTDISLATNSNYEALLNKIKSHFITKDISQISINQLLQIIEEGFSYVPSSTNRAEVCDISLYVHSKITSAVASCMKLYFDEQQIQDYKKYCFNSGSKIFRNEKIYLLVSGDISGIQDFIYTIPSKGALKTLRGRSLYIDLLLEEFIDEYLEQIGLSRANVLYSGGGHFYILAPNIEDTKKSIDKLQAKMNRWLMENIGINLYLAIGMAECSANNLMKSEAQGNLFAIVNKKLKDDKTIRYSKDEDFLEYIFNVEKEKDTAKKECNICHNLVDKLWKYNSDEEIACEFCLNLYKLGQDILTQDLVFVISEEKIDGGIKIFGKDKDLYMYAVNIEDIDMFKGKILRIYSKNNLLESDLAIRLYLADYSAKNENDEVMTFDDLAKSSCKTDKGIKILGVLRLDVDDLGIAFSSGFVSDKDKIEDNLRYATLSRYADLSKDISMFFKVAINKICAGDLIGCVDFEEKAFNIFGIAKAQKRKVNIIYAGGDDLFLVGAWDEVLEVAIDINRAFKQFTNGKLTLSAGMAMFSPTYPISKMAEIAGLLVQMSKNRKDKNSIALFGMEINLKVNGQLECKHIYTWVDFEMKVCKEKMNYLLARLSFDGDKFNKLSVGKSLIYRLMDLIQLADEDKLNIARFAYVLARMQPKQDKDEQKRKVYEDFVSKMYQWINNNEDKKQLATALNLLVYYLRDKKE
ncbi:MULTISPECIES: type III-A CRISPR-associated protein Cas10/Csm1 [Megamonas]|uniref:CRISPR system single-strand-specific deoxyribonuclease Cas10/Csm1 (subtype III-A) n=1 Tax=Megamonas rupellensis TaxID=491921 RepID=A0A411ZTK1_9FIRM|nr:MULTISPECIES: type III-A CRISPR-associated protein Cas10/Csm1 [Megamonas]RGO05732.1 type III-A CRISPR-associated protein Cas10/Csm1 [Megamonas rupellensis]RGQ06138.1 type III-A CRISPR-associated protein Cas10/Csm1 [Megamonas rupellensis]